MNDDSYESGDFVVIRDVQKANQTIAMAGNIQMGAIVKIERIHSGLIICEEAKPPNDAEIKPFPPNYENSPRLQQHENGNSNNRIADEDSREIASDVSEYLANDQDNKSDVLK